MGYHRAGLEVVGVDLHPQPNYPFEIAQGDALTFFDSRWIGRNFDAIHASPPCQAHSSIGRQARDRDATLMHVDLIPQTRALLAATGLPWVIENVPGAPIRRDIILCGSTFNLGATCLDGTYRQLRRHRWFETNWPVGMVAPCQHDGEAIGVYGTGGGGHMQHSYKARPAEAREAMGIDWMAQKELSQAIPPAYCTFIGEQLMQHIRTKDTTHA